MTPPPSPASPTGRVDELDGIRGLLALWVAVAHGLSWVGYWEFKPPGPLARHWIDFLSGEAAVDLFIILSGFAISALLERRQSSYPRFLLGRAFRIYPVYLTCLAIGLVVIHLSPFVLRTALWRDTIYFEWNRAHSASELASPGAHTFWHVTLLNGLVPRRWLANTTSTVLLPAWSITLEWQYYLVAPLIARWVKSGLGLLLLVAVSVVGLRWGMGFKNPHLAFLPAHLPLFLIGIGSYHLHARFGGPGQPRSPLAAVPVAALLGFTFLTSWHPIALGGWALGFGCLFARGDDPFSRALALLRRALLHPWLQYLGQRSFPIYLLHWPLIITLLHLLLRQHPQVSQAQAALFLLAVGLPLLLTLAIALHRWVERPGMALGKRWTDRQPAS
jgi:peptidoglycan/LPS O-acetylase OafA/YrhL